MKRTILTTVAVLVILLLLAACGGNQEMNKLETIMKHGTIIAGTSADYPPIRVCRARQGRWSVLTWI